MSPPAPLFPLPVDDVLRLARVLDQVVNVGHDVVLDGEDDVPYHDARALRGLALLERPDFACRRPTTTNTVQVTSV